MTLETLDLPDGIYRGATEYSSKGRWYDCNLVRFRDSVIAPVGGWRPRSANAVTGIARALHTWSDNDDRGWIGIGTHLGLFIQSRAGANLDITPLGFTAGRPDAVNGGGFGTGAWSRETWGTRRLDVVGVLPANTWSLDNAGENLVAMFDAGSPPYEWSPAAVNPAVLRANTAQAGAASTITLDAGASAANDFYNGYYVVITAGTGAGQSRLIFHYVGATKVATVTVDWKVNPNNTSVFAIRYSGAVANAPTGTALVVTDENSLMMIGAEISALDPLGAPYGGGPKRLAWSDLDNIGNWEFADETSEAGFLDLKSKSELMAIMLVRGGILVLSRTDAFFVTYRGTAFAYGSERVGSNCGIVSRRAFTVINGVAYWRGVNGFYSFDGAVNPLQCDVWEFFKSSSNPTQQSKFWAMGNSSFDEVWWYDCDNTHSEINRYFYMNIKDGHWSNGLLVRSAGDDTGVFADPLQISPAGVVYEHETGVTYDGALPYIESGPLEIGKGDTSMTIDEWIPDERQMGQVTLTLKGRFWPEDEEFTQDIVNLTSPQSFMFNCRQVKARFTGLLETDFRIGLMRFNYKARGKR